MFYYLICTQLLAIFLLIFAQSARGFVPQAQTCNPQVDVQFAEDPTGTTSFLKCRNYGPPEYGYWERHYCPNDMSFEFSSQQCKTATMPPNAVRQENEILHIAILNGTCANGEQCIGGTVCDLAKRRCLCPYGSVANLETLSCVQPQNMANGNSLIQPQQPNAPVSSSSATAATAQQQIQQQYANYYGQASNRYSSQPSVSPSASSSPMGTTSLNQFYRSVLDQLQQARTAVLQQSQNPSTKIVANIQQTVTTGAAPGGSCAHGERCEGGSICMHPMNVCLCPGELESQNGQCVPSYQKAISGIAKVGIGARCNQYNTFCDFESNCVNGYCKCLLPVVEQAGKCVQPAVRKESGPGEACHNGELCVRGSVCDQQVPVCVCPAGTSLENGWCIQPTRPPPNPPAPATTNLITEHTTNSNYNNQNSGESGSAYVTGGGYIPPPSSPPASTETFSKQNPIKKPAGHVGNAHKQQSTVGDRCSLNTECMLGAYCNGNSQPPTCQCLSTHVNVNDRCEKVIFPGQKGCDNDLQCTTAYAGTRCINRQCVCPPGSKAIEQTCVSVHAWPGEQCNQSNPIPACSGQSYCSDHGVCGCPPPLIIYQKQCVARPQTPMPISNHQTTVCIQDSECPTNFLCLDNRCECPPERVRHNSECVSVLPLDSTLEDLNKEEGLREAPVLRQTPGGIEQIFSTIAMLKNAHIRPYEEIPSFGQLTSNQVMQDTEKRRRKRDSWSRTSMVKHNGEPCVPGDICLNGTSCANGVCSCPAGYRFQSNTCSRLNPSHSNTPTYRSINSECMGADRCSGGSICRNSVCSCVDGSVESQGSCKQRPLGRCSYGQLCTGGSNCHLGTCQCPPGHRLLANTCILAISNPGQSCQSGERCANGSVCRFGGVYVSVRLPLENKCEKISTKKSSIKHSSTSSGIRHKAMASQPKQEPKKMVLSTSKPGNLCLHGEACTGGSVCNKQGYCSCAEEEIIIEDKCVSSNGEAIQAIERISKSAPGQLCTDDSTCTGHSVCRANICLCPEESTLFRGECLGRPSSHDLLANKNHALLFSP